MKVTIELAATLLVYASRLWNQSAGCKNLSMKKWCITGLVIAGQGKKKRKCKQTTLLLHFSVNENNQQKPKVVADFEKRLPFVFLLQNISAFRKDTNHHLLEYIKVKAPDMNIHTPGALYIAEMSSLQFHIVHVLRQFYCCPNQ